MCFVYILESRRSGRFYIGCTEDLLRRFHEHASGQTQSTRDRGPWLMCHWEAFATLSEARRRERQLKRWKSAAAIRRLLDGVYGADRPWG
jgi:putative endonuclease